MPVIPGSNDPENLPGTPDDDTITGLAGNDTIDGGGGNDVVYGGNDADLITGTAGLDTLYGDAGNDTLNAGADLSFSYGGDGDDEIHLGPTIGNGSAAQGYGGADNDTIFVAAPLGGIAEGGDGDDLLAYTSHLSGQTGMATAIDISAGSGTATGSFGTSLTFSGFERLYFVGGDGADSVTGGALNDTIYGGRGLNELHGGAGDDRMAVGYGGQQTLDGGEGNDTLIVIDATMPVYFIVDGDGSVDDGQLSDITGFEHYEIEGSLQDDIIRTGEGSDLLRGFRGHDTLIGADGNDFLRGDHGKDELWGGTGRDTLSGNGLSDTLYGGDENDRLTGGDGADVLFGDAGRDTLFGGTGADLMWGGDGADIFRFQTLPEGSAAEDWIGDFETGSDRLVFAADILGGTPVPGQMGAADLSVGAVSGSNGQFLLVELGTGFQSLLYWDADGTGVQDATLLVILMHGEAVAGSDIWIV